MSNGFHFIESTTKKHPIILFDGVCNLCNSTVQWVITKDKKNIFKFTSLQADHTQEYLEKKQPQLLKVDSILLVTEKKIYTKSSAALKIAKLLNNVYSLLYIFFIIPKPIRDFAYDYIAKNRYKWFGKQESCWLPSPDLKSKFL